MNSVFLLNEKSKLPVYIECTWMGEQSYCDRTKDCKCLPQITLCIEGTGVFQDENGKKHELIRGDIFGFRGNVPHTYYPTSDSWKVAWLTFDGKMADDIMDYAGLGGTFVIKPDSIRIFEKIYTYMEYTHLEFWKADEFKHNNTSSVLYTILLMLGRVIKNSPQQYVYTDEKEERLAPVVRKIVTYFNENLSSASLADTIGVSVKALNKLFNEVYHITPMMYLRNVRLFYAQHELLRNKSIRIADVAENAGFYDVSYFCKLFTEKFGESPKHYQESHTIEELIGISSILGI